MPIYQYQCADCGHQLEALQRMGDPKLTDCPECETPALKKQLTAAAFKLKGTGWYETDFKNSGKKPDATESNSTNSSVETPSPATEVESKPAKTAATAK